MTPTEVITMEAVIAGPQSGAHAASRERWDPVTIGLWLTAVGAIAQIVGLADDAWLHHLDAGLAQHEGPLTLTNQGHALIAAGLVLAAVGAWTALAVPRIASRLLRAAPPVALVVAIATGAAFASSTGTHAGATTSHVDHSAATAPTVAPAAHAHVAPGVPAAPDVVLDPATHAALMGQLGQARAAALRYPTLADAERVGYTLSAPYDPGIGAHYMKFSDIDTVFDAARPEMLLYDGDAPGSHVVGVMYYVVDANRPPAGFAGPYDQWHAHAETCVTRTGAHFVGDDGGTLCGHAGQFEWMLHAWVVPGHESVEGTFSERNDSLS